MRKEILLAIIVGIIVGLGFTFLVYTVRQRLFQNSTPDAIENSRQQGSASPTPSPLSTLSLQQPEQDLYTQQETVQVVGRALPNSYIVILSNTTEYITTADADGDFAQTIELASGGNRITVIATSSEGQQDTVIRQVVYSTVALDETASESAAPAATAAAATATPKATAKPTVKPTIAP